VQFIDLEPCFLKGSP